MRSLAFPAVVVAVLGALLWTVHVLRLRRRERQLLAVIERMVGVPVGEAAEEQPRDAVRAAAAAAYEPTARVLIVAGGETRDRLARRLAALGIQAAGADSEWSAAVACRDAFEAGGPYNLVLLDATILGRPGAGELARFEGAVKAWGVRVALVRPPADVEAVHDAGDAGVHGAPPVEGCEPWGTGSWLEESVGPDENPDRRGRAGVAAAAAADAGALGLRSQRRQ